MTVCLPCREGHHDECSDFALWDGHDIPPNAPPTSTEGWHRHTHPDGSAVCWATDRAIARRAQALYGAGAAA